MRKKNQASTLDIDKRYLAESRLGGKTKARFQFSGILFEKAGLLDYVIMSNVEA